VRKVLLCSGRITWDLMVQRAKREVEDTAIVRVERLYPRPVEELQAELGRYSNLAEVRWVQDEPANMGPAPHFRLHVFDQLPVPVTVLSRPESSSPSVGNHKRHVEEQAELIDKAFA
jgi:2-oxoglutarate dehydrogenase E1 component